MGILNADLKGPAINKKLEPRARVELRLTGGTDGAIPLSELAQVAEHAQELVRKLARAIVGKDGAGRPPAYLSRLTDLVAVGIHDGSAVLEIEAPAWSSELDLTDEVEPDAGVRALDMVTDALTTVAQGLPLPEAFTKPSRDELRSLLEATGQYDRFDWKVQHHGKEKTASLAPGSGRVPPLLQHGATPPERGSVEGELYALNSKTGTYTLEDAYRHAIRCHVDPVSPLASRLDRLVRSTVRLSGELTRDQTGRITGVAVEHIESEPELDDATFWNFDAQAAITEAKPIGAVDELALVGLTVDEGDSFRAALGFE